MEKIESAKQYYNSSRKIAFIACIICLLMNFLYVSQVADIDSNDSNYLSQLKESGVILGLDMFGLEEIVNVPQQYRIEGLKDFTSYGLINDVTIKKANVIDYFFSYFKSGKILEDSLYIGILTAVLTLAVPLLTLLFNALGVHIPQVAVGVLGLLYSIFYFVKMYKITVPVTIYCMGWVPFLAPLVMLALMGVSINCMMAKNEYKKAENDSFTPVQS